MIEEAKKNNPFEDLDAIRKAAEAEAGKDGGIPPAAEEVTTSGGRRKRKPGFLFMSADWVDTISQIRPHPPWGVAIFLIRAFRRQAARQVVVRNVALKAWGIGPEAKLHDLREIEAAGLIEIKLYPGYAPLVSWLVDPDG
jgi:hypothetical protein